MPCHTALTQRAHPHLTHIREQARAHSPEDHRITAGLGVATASSSSSTIVARTSPSVARNTAYATPTLPCLIESNQMSGIHIDAQGAGEQLTSEQRALERYARCYTWCYTWCNSGGGARARCRWAAHGRSASGVSTRKHRAYTHTPEALPCVAAPYACVYTRVASCTVVHAIAINRVNPCCVCIMWILNCDPSASLLSIITPKLHHLLWCNAITPQKHH